MVTGTANRRAMPYTMPEDGQIQSVSIYHDGGSGNLLLGVYNDDNGKPDERLAVTASTPIHSYAGWQTVQLTSPVDVNEGDTIWLAWVFQNIPGIRYASGTPGRAHSDQTWSGGMPSDFGSSTIANYKYSIYASYTPDVKDEDIELIGNPYMFTGRRFDFDTELYYYRARYYNPYIGRFLQTDPIGYNDGMNWYNYCANNPVGMADSLGTHSYSLTNAVDRYGDGFYCALYNDDGNLVDEAHLGSVAAFIQCVGFWDEMGALDDEWKKGKPGWILSDGQKDWFWYLQLLMFFDSSWARKITNIETKITGDNPIDVALNFSTRNWYTPSTNTVEWDTSFDQLFVNYTVDNNPIAVENWHKVHPMAMLAHELAHLYDDVWGTSPLPETPANYNQWMDIENVAMRAENKIRTALADYFPSAGYVRREMVDRGKSVVGNIRYKYFPDEQYALWRRQRRDARTRSMNLYWRTGIYAY